MEAEMSLDEESFKRKVEEFKEAGHEYRYRDQLMVQEFSLSMVAAGVLLNVIAKDPSGPEALVVQFFGVVFLVLLTLHLRNINQDRRTALARKEVLRKELEFEVVHGNVSGLLRIRVPLAMIRFTGTVAVAWAIWTAISMFRYFSYA
jgi:hypothetical protein